MAGSAERRTVLDFDGRAKAYRPIAAPARTAAVIAGLHAYAEGDFFEAHELHGAGLDGLRRSG